jgi:hypothetical protein
VRQRPKLVILVGLLVALVATLSWLKPAGALLDGRLYYTGPEALTFIAELGAAGRRVYFWHECIDLAFSVTYSLLLRELAVWCRLKGAWALLPGSLDLLENFGIFALLSAFPAAPRSLASALGYVTLFKWLAASAWLLALAWSRWRFKRPVGDR